jgi:hypothetical protein
MRIWTHPEVDCRLLSERTEFWIGFHFRSRDQYAVRKITREVRWIFMAQKQFSAARLQPVSADN